MSFLKRIGSLRKNSYSLSKRAELTSPYDNKSNIHCLVVLLDGTLLTCDIDKQSSGQVLLDRVFLHLGLHEKDYFGLAYKADGGVTRWLDAAKPLTKQLKGHSPQFDFRVRFYVPDPSWLHEEATRYLFVLQIRKDILANRLPCSFESAATLGSYIIQAELRDYDPEEHTQGYVSQIRMFPNQTKDLEARIATLHMGLQSRPAPEMDVLFLSHARRLDFYGVELFACKDADEVDVDLGITLSGITVFQNMLILKVHPWSNVIKITYKRKKFFVELRSEQAIIGYQMISYESCKQLWRNCIDYHSFFKLGLPPVLREQHVASGREPLNRSHTYREKTEHKSAGIRRSPSVTGQSTDAATRNGDMKNVKSESSVIIRKAVSLREAEKPEYVKQLLVRRKVDDVSSFNESDERPVSPESFFDDMMNGGEYTIPHCNSVHNGHSGRLSSGSLTIASTSNGSGPGTLATAMPTVPYASHDEGGASREVGGASDEPSDHCCYQNTDEAVRFHLGDLLSEGMLCVHLDPDPMGRFGFNVKGGMDQKMPVMVSKVAINSPASHCKPPLQEGDQIIYINGRSVGDCTHDQVISMIRQPTQSQSHIPLSLVIKPCDLNRVTPIIKVEDMDSSSMEADPGLHLRRSLTELKDSLQSKKLLLEFDQLYRRMPGLSTNTSKAAQNLVKNRYRDVLPYDVTRVLLQEGPDYINASYVNIELESRDDIIKYIVTQGPMQHTAKDFWQMVWEQNSTILVMLTQIMEEGKVRCFQYWPEKVQSSVEYGRYHICTVTEEVDRVSVTRTLRLKNMEKGEERTLLHVQYTDWPDHHEIPGSYGEFCRFVRELHHLRQSTKEPPIIHCSSGAGRTGAFILIEAALSKIESLEPVHPLAIVRAMRNQRGMLLQTMAQYQFACECILKAYEEDYLEIILPKESSFPNGPH